MSLDSVPKDMRQLRACKLCSMIKVGSLFCLLTTIGMDPLHIKSTSKNFFLQSFDQFLYSGCDNCERYLRMKGNREMVNDCTSSNFDGYVSSTKDDLDPSIYSLFSSFRFSMVAMMSPEDSWVGKWQRIGTSRIHL